jgi:hypothetical protein
VLKSPAVEITTNVGCPVGCRYCPQKTFLSAYGRISPVRAMTLELFDACLGRIPRHVAIDFSGMSEPWGNPRCTEMVVRACGKGHEVRVHTTLVGMSARDLEILSRLPLAAFRVHVPSAQGLEHISVDESYLGLLLQAAAQIGSARFVCLGESAHPAVSAALRSAGAKIRIASPSHRADIPCVAGKPPILMRRGAIRCAKDARYNVLLPNGDVLLCCMDYGLRHVLGNLLSTDYEGLFLGDPYRAVVAGWSDPSVPIPCRACAVFAFHENALQDLRCRVPHWVASLRGVRGPRSLLAAAGRNILRYRLYFDR